MLSVQAPASTLSPLEILRACLRRDWHVAISYRLPFATDAVAVFANLALFFFLGRVVDRQASSADLPHGYFAFAILGMALLRIAQSGLTSLAGRLRTEQTTGTLEVLFTTPAPPSLVVLGSTVYDLLYATLTSAVLVVIGVAVFGLAFDVHPAGILAGLVAVACCALLFAAFGIALAAFTVVFKQTLSLLSLAMPALAVLGTVYFPVTVLPGALQAVVRAFPFFWAVDSLRAGLLDGQAHLGQLLSLAGAVAVAVPLSSWLFVAALRRARRTGTMGQY